MGSLHNIPNDDTYMRPIGTNKYIYIYKYIFIYKESNNSD